MKELSNKQESIAVVFSHGLKRQSRNFMFLYRLFAHMGIPVYSVDHHDRSAFYAEANGTEGLSFDYDNEEQDASKSIHTNRRLREIQVKIRIEELKQLIAEQVTEQRVIVMGHSFGAPTAIEVARTDPTGKVVACVALDPWWFPIDTLMKNDKKFELRLPSLIISA